MLVGLLSGCATSISGQLKSARGDDLNIVNGKVNIVRVDGGEAQPYVVVVDVDSAGRFTTIEKVPPGNYLVEALIPGYKPASMHVDLEQSKKIELLLTPIRSAAHEIFRIDRDIEASKGAGGVLLMPPEL